MSINQTQETIIEDDPILGKFIANYPVNRLRLLFYGGVVLALVWFVVTVALWNVAEGFAAAATVAVITIAALIVGWGITHLWNREVILYARGFSYRRGGQNAFLRYTEIHVIRQKGEIISYFGGIVRRSTLVVTLITDVDEIITLTALYNRINELSTRLEVAITQARLPVVKSKIEVAEPVTFGAGITLDAEGLHADDHHIPWAQVGTVKAANRQLVISNADASVQIQRPLSEIENLRLLVILLQESST